MISLCWPGNARLACTHYVWYMCDGDVCCSAYGKSYSPQTNGTKNKNKIQQQQQQEQRQQRVRVGLALRSIIILIMILPDPWNTCLVARIPANRMINMSNAKR